MIKALGFLLFGLAGVSASAATCFGNGDLTSPDGGVTARIFRNVAKGGCGESRIELVEADGHLLAIADYTSQDGESGEGIYQAAWSADSQYLVFSHAKSGARQPRFILDVYARKGNTLRPLKDDLQRADFSFVGNRKVTASGNEIALP